MASPRFSCYGSARHAPRIATVAAAASLAAAPLAVADPTAGAADERSDSGEAREVRAAGDSLDGAARHTPPVTLEIAPVELGPLEDFSIPFAPSPPRLVEPRALERSGDWRAPNRFWTASHVTTILTLGGLQYWIGKGGYPRWAPSDWPSRFSADAQILDVNDFITNYSFHTIAGAGYHLAARTNDLSVFEAAAWSLGASLAWEYVVEFRDKSDINDIIFTTPAGVAIGEFTHQLGRLLQQRRGSLAWDAARWSAGFPQSFNDAISGADSPRGPPIDHDLYVAAGAAHGRARDRRAGERETDDGMLGTLRFGGRLSALGNRYRPGTRWRGFRDGQFTSLDVVLAGGPGDRRNTYVLSDTVLAGWRYTDIADDGRRGTALNLGTSTAVRYHRERHGAWRDQIGMAHLPGLAVDAERWWGPSWRLRGLARLHPDYGGVHAFGYQDWQAAHPDELGISVVEKENYYHAWGGSARLGAELQSWRLRAGGSLFLAAYRPHTNLDEFRPGRPHHDPETIEEQFGSDRGNNTTVQSIASRFSDYELWLRGDLPRELFVEARAVARHRRERFDEFDTRARAFQAGVEVGASF